MRQTLTASKVTKINTGEEPLNFKEVFYLATLGGAKCMGLDKKIGNWV
jgi:cytosine/adenosine deaminase-related metal-dependent hydrolase